jgi:hypothetical protein
MYTLSKIKAGEYDVLNRDGEKVFFIKKYKIKSSGPYWFGGFGKPIHEEFWVCKHKNENFANLQKFSSLKNLLAVKFPNGINK